MRLVLVVLALGALGSTGCVTASVAEPVDDRAAQNGDDRDCELDGSCPAYDDCPDQPTCDGDGYLIWCFEGQFVEIDCIAHGATCGDIQTVGEVGDACIYP
jgi:hypothetical protein